MLPAKNFGFTIIELLITVTLISIMLLIAMPNMSDLVLHNRATTNINTIISALQLARSEAINRKIKVKYCQSSNYKTCGGNWKDGQIIIDEDGKLLRTFAALNYHDTLIWNSSLNRDEYVEFTSDGCTNGQVGTFIYTPNGQKKYAKAITINHAGRVRIVD
jgi:type IV fimbrial biogenesis protein FimT